MAISATFRADFAQFVSAVNQAETKLKSFQTGAASVEKSLTRMGDSFSGRKILSEATLAVKAVTDIGGVTKLTETEQRRLNATVTEALAKYKALGQQAPSDMVELEKATRGAEQSTTTLGSAAAAAEKALARMADSFSGREILSEATLAVKAVTDLGGVTKLTEQEQRHLNATVTEAIAKYKALGQQVPREMLDIQKATKQTEAALIKMGDSFSGRQLLSEATLAVKAVNDIGGATKLTDAEQRRLNATLTEALAKYKALGQQAPRDMVELEKATRGAEQSMSGLGLSLKSVGTNILTTAAGFFTAQAAFAAVKFAVTGLVSELKTIALTGATYADVAANFDHLTASSGRLGSTLLGELRAGTHGTISDFDLMKTATQDLAAGLNLTDQQFGTLAQGAFALAQATGGDVATALDTMNDAMLTGRTRGLALLTGKIDLEKAETAFAKSLGATRDQLSEEGKLQAARIGTLNSVGEAITRLGVQTDGLDEKVAQASANWANFKLELGRLVATSPVIMAGLDSIGAALTEAFGAEKGNLVRAIADLIDDAAIALANFAKIAVTSAGFLVTEYYAIYKLWGNLRQIIDLVTVSTLYLGKAQMALPNAIGIGTEAYKANNDAIQRLMVTMVARGKALQDADKAQASVGTTTAGYIKTLDRMVLSMEAARGTQGNLAAGAAAAGSALSDAGTAAGTAGTRVAGATSAFLSGASAAKLLAKDTKELSAEQKKFIDLTDAESVKGWATELDRVDDLARLDRQALYDMNLELDRQLEDTQALKLAQQDAAALVIMREELDLYILQTQAMEDQAKVLIEIANNRGLQLMAQDAAKMRGAWSGMFDGLKNAGSQALSDLNSVFKAAFEGGGGIGGALKSLATNVTSNLLSLIPMVGPIVSQFAGAIVAGLSKLGNLFGIGKSEGRLQLEEANREIRALQANLLDTYGSLDRIREVAGEAGQELAAAWGSQNRAGLEHFRDLLGDFNDELERQQRITGVYDDLLGTRFFEDMADLQEAYARLTPEQLANDIILDRLVKRYISLQEETGLVIPGLQELALAWQLNAAGAKLVTDQTRGAVSEFKNLQTAVDKIAWPGGDFKPPTQAEIDLFLQNNPGDVHRIRDAFTNTPGQPLQTAANALKAADSMKAFNAEVTAIERVLGSSGGGIDTIQDTTFAATDMTDALYQTDAGLLMLTDTLGAFGEQAAAVNASLGSMPSFSDEDTTSDWMQRERALSNPDGALSNAIPMASGGYGRVTKPTLFLAGEAGPEDVAFSGGGRSFGGGTGAGDVTIHIGSIELRDVGTRDPESLATDLLDRLVQKIRRNERGNRTGLRVALGVA